MKVDQQTFHNLKITTADGKTDVQEYKSEKQATELQAEAAKLGSAVEITKSQTFGVSTADSIDEMLTIVPNAEVALDFFNYGLTLAQHNVKRELMKDAEWPGVEGVYDLLADVQQPKEKRVADPLASSRRALKSLWSKLHPGEPEPDEAAINAVLAQFAGVATETAA